MGNYNNIADERIRIDYLINGSYFNITSPRVQSYEIYTVYDEKSGGVLKSAENK